VFFVVRWLVISQEAELLARRPVKTWGVHLLMGDLVMLRIAAFLLLGGVLLYQGPGASAQPAKKKTAKDALQPFNELIGEWRGTGVPKGTPKEVQKGFWVETMDWSWKFKGEDAWLTVTFDKGKHFVKGELHYLPEKDEFQFTVQTTDKKTLVFTGTYEDRWLTLLREDKEKKESQKLVIRLLHYNRFWYQYDVKAEEKSFYTMVYKVGATKLGEEFAVGDGQPECIVSGGLGTSKVMHKGMTYYVCCSGCRDEFLASPEKYIAAAEKKKKK
jgi:hypothetical protein